MSYSDTENAIFIESYSVKGSKLLGNEKSIPIVTSTMISTPPRNEMEKVTSTVKSPSTDVMTSVTAVVANIQPVESIEIDRIYKILVVGNAKCGKSSIISKYAFKNNLDGKYRTTIGADFVRKDILVDTSDGRSIGVRLQLWDIAGQDRFQKLTRAYFSKARGVVIVCDVSREGTIEAVKSWKSEIDVWSDQSDCKDIPVVLFANKSDLLENPQDAFKTGAIMERICRELGFLGWWVTSAKTGESLDEAFNILVRKIIMIDELKLIAKSDSNKSTSSIKRHNKNVSSNYSNNNSNSNPSESGIIRLSALSSNNRSDRGNEGCNNDDDDDDDDDRIIYRNRRLHGGDCC